MKRFAVAVAVIPFLATVAKAAQEWTVIVVTGNCQVLQIASQSTACATPASAVYTSLPNGIVLFDVPLADGRVYGFVGDRDAQPKREQYVLYLKRVRLANGPEPGTPVDVSGTCKMNVSTDGSIVHRIICNATDSQGGEYLLDFLGDGKPVEVKRF